MTDARARSRLGAAPLYRFYTNALKSVPDRALLRDMHRWQGNYKTLEHNHGAAVCCFTVFTLSFVTVGGWRCAQHGLCW